MKKFEYKIEYLKLEVGRDNEEQILESLNRFGQDGWRMVRQYGEISMRSIASFKGGMNFLLERELQST